MKRSIKNLTGYTIEAIDGPKGKVGDFLFDEESWIIRYIEADFGGIFNNKRVLIPKAFLEEPDWDNKHFPVNLTGESIEACPDLEEKAPVSREYEKELSKHYDLSHYWPYAYTESAAAAMIFPPRPMEVPARQLDENDLDTSLRSFREVEGYHVNALDGKFGHIDDLLVDETDWQVVYAVIDTSNWKPWSRKVLLLINWLDKISYTKREIDIKLHTKTIKDAPEFEGISSLNLDYENALYEFYRNSLSG